MRTRIRNRETGINKDPIRISSTVNQKYVDKHIGLSQITFIRLNPNRRREKRTR